VEIGAFLFGGKSIKNYSVNTSCPILVRYYFDVLESNFEEIDFEEI